jgi:BirA family transcriptional regulator, biotin operon repressor / biotin---[acetyl-CoA-carboxylase] ligase
VIIGVGINANLLHDNKQHDISAPWISLREILNKYIDRNVFAAALINNLLSYLDNFNANGFQVFMDEWKQCDYLAQKNITLKIGQRKIHGQACGIDQHGHILLHTADGVVQHFSSGDATLVE